MNKYNFFGTFAVAGIIIYALGVWAKITHQSWSDETITVGLIFGAIGLSAFCMVLVYVVKKKIELRSILFSLR